MVPKAIICDLDGTLANEEHRRPAVTGTGWGAKEYDEYFSKIEQDTVFKHIHDILESFNSFHPDKYHIIFLTGRPERFRQNTMNWLEKNTSIKPFDLFMRKDRDYRCDVDYKKEIYNKFIKDKYNVLFVLEDRTRVVALWRNLGLPCLQVQQSDY